MQAMHLDVGDVYKGVFQVEEIRRGGMSTIYVCTPFDREEGRADVETRRTVLKTLTTDFYLHGSNAQQFEQEALIWTTLPPHPYVLSCISVDRIEQAPLILLEYAAGGSLRDRLSGGALPLTEALTTFRQVCSGMVFLFECGSIVHRDVKPDNILLSASGDVQLTDFGLSSLQRYGLKLLRGMEAPGAATETVGHWMGGTLPYMSPEHFGEAPVSIASDVYSFGAVMFEVLAGELMFACGSVDEYRDAHLSQEPKTLAADVAPPEVAAVVARCVEKDPASRFASFGDLDHALAEAIDRAGVTVRAPEWPTVAELEAKIDSSGWNLRGYAFAQLSRFEESLRCYQRAWELDPTKLPANLNMGTALERVGRPEEALPYFEREVELQPDTVLVRSALAFAYLRRGRVADAHEQLRLAVETHPDDITTVRELGFFERQLGSRDGYERAVDRIEAILAAHPDRYTAVSWVNEGMQHGERGELETALRFFTGCTRRYPEYVDGWYNLAVTQLFHGDRVAAEQSLLHALSIEPHLIQGHYLRALLMLARGEVARAVSEWQRVTQVAPGHLFSRTVPDFVRLAAEASGADEARALAAATLATVPIGYFYYR